MKFTPKQLEENVNLSKTHPLTEFLWLVGGLVVMAAIVFFSLGVISDWAATIIPISVEDQWGHLAIDEFQAQPNQPLQKRLNALLTALPEDSPLHQYDFKIYLTDSEDVNAFALPGGRIVVFSGLIDAVDSENELSMVLAHELGHFAHRDHLRGLGRGLGVAVAAALLFGSDSSAGDLASKSFLTFQLKYSQAQESAADRFGLDLLTARYGHAGGATSFFSRLAQEAGSKLPYILASHPHPQDRLSALNKRIESMGYALSPPLPLKDDLKSDEK